jgi:hypothetical protein
LRLLLWRLAEAMLLLCWGLEGAITAAKLQEGGGHF